MSHKNLNLQLRPHLNTYLHSFAFYLFRSLIVYDSIFYFHTSPTMPPDIDIGFFSVFVYFGFELLLRFHFQGNLLALKAPHCAIHQSSNRFLIWAFQPKQNGQYQKYSSLLRQPPCFD